MEIVKRIAIENVVKQLDVITIDELVNVLLNVKGDDSIGFCEDMVQKLLHTCYHIEERYEL